MKKILYVFFVLTLLLTIFWYTRILYFIPWFIPWHYIHLRVNKWSYEKIVNYHANCELTKCSVVLSWWGCGEWKECFRDIEDKYYLALLTKTDIWNVYATWWVFYIAPLSAVDNDTNVLWWSANYNPKFEYVYIVDEEIDKNLSHSEELFKFNKNWHIYIKDLD